MAPRRFHQGRDPQPHRRPIAINEVAGIDAPNVRFYESDVLAPPSGQFADAGRRSTVYPAAGDAVHALLALGVDPGA